MHFFFINMIFIVNILSLLKVTAIPKSNLFKQTQCWLFNDTEYLLWLWNSNPTENHTPPVELISEPHTQVLPLFAQSLTDVLSVPDAQLDALSLPRLRRDMGLKSSFPSGWGLEDMGMPYRKLDRTELQEVAGLDDVTTWEAAFPGPWLLGVMVAVEELWLTSMLVFVPRDKSSVALRTETKWIQRASEGWFKRKKYVKRSFLVCLYLMLLIELHGIYSFLVVHFSKWYKIEHW